MNRIRRFQAFVIGAKLCALVKNFPRIRQDKQVIKPITKFIR